MSEQISILYVEDDPLDQELTIRQLAKQAPHLEIAVAGDPVEAKRLLTDKTFDLIMVDYRLPGENGITLIAWIKEKRFPSATVIVTGSGDEKTALAALKAGADDYIVKQSGYLDRLPAVIENVLYRYRTREAIRGKPLRVLYGEHNEADMNLSQRYFKQHAPHICLEAASTGQACLSKLEDENFDAVIIDYRMPGMSGLDLLKEIHSRDLCLPVIMVTGGGDENVAVQSIKLGASDYIVKTGEYIQKLPYAIEQAVAQRRLKESEKALKESGQVNKLLLDSLPHSAMLIRRDRTILAANRKAREAGAKIGGRCWCDFAHCQYITEVQKQCLNEEDDAIPPAGIKCTFCLADDAFSANEPANNPEVEAFGRIWDISWFPIDSDMLLRYAINITEKKKLENQLRQAQKMESIGTLAGGIAHDFNNLLTPILGYAEMLLEEPAESAYRRKGLTEIIKMANRASDLVKRILTISRKNDDMMGPLKIQSVVMEVIKFVQSSLPATIEISHDICHDCGLTMANATQIHQVAMNLITNAYHAMEDEGGKLRITLKEVEIEIEEIKALAIDPGSYIRLAIADTGSGIDKSIIDRIFDPYFSTKDKDKDKGTGLGLAVVHGIVKSHGGHIRIHSEPGKGSEFQVYLPVIKSQGTAPKAANPMKRLPLASL